MFKGYDFEVINNAIDYDKYSYSEYNRLKIRNELDLKNNRVLGFVGRYTPQKNVFFFIDLIKKLPNEYMLVMIGDGQQKEEFIKRVKNDKLDYRFVFINETPYVNEYYSAFDYFLLPSLYEGLPVVGVEAQANGLPCLFSNTISDECKISNNTFYLDRKNIDDWVKEIKSLNRNENLVLNDDFNIKIQAKRFEDTIEKILL